MPHMVRFTGCFGQLFGNTLREHIGSLGNLLGAHWELEKEHVGNKGKKKKIPPLPHPKLKRKKIKALWVHAKLSHWVHKISMFRNRLLPFFAYANNCIINWGYLIFIYFSFNSFHEFVFFPIIFGYKSPIIVHPPNRARIP